LHCALGDEALVSAVGMEEAGEREGGCGLKLTEVQHGRVVER
jgi:hypothetical protein